MVTVRWLACVSMALVLVARVSAQSHPTATPGAGLNADPFSSDGLEQDARRARDLARLHLIYLRGRSQALTESATRPRQGLDLRMGLRDAFAVMEGETWTDPTLRRWLAQHAVVSEVNIEEQPERFADLARRATTFGRTNADPVYFPHILILKDGQEIGVIPSSGYANNLTGVPEVMVMRDIEAWRMAPKPAQMLGQLDYVLRAAMSRDPVWGARHEMLNPPAGPDPSDPFHARADGFAAVVTDPPPGDPAISDPLVRLAEARAAVAAGDPHLALGLYTWLWERAADLDPSLEPSLRSLIAPEINAISATRPGLAARFRSMTFDLQGRVQFFAPDDWTHLRLLAAAADQPEAAADSRMLMTADGADPLVSPADNAAIQLAFSGDLPLMGPPPDARGLSRLAAQIAQLAARPPRGWTDEEIELVQEFRSRLIIAEACRAAALFREAGDNAARDQVRGMLLGAAGTLHPPRTAESLTAALDSAERIIAGRVAGSGGPK